MSLVDLEEYAKLVEEHPDFRVLRRLAPRDSFDHARGSNAVRGIVIDTETTGKNASTDLMIEITAVLFEYSPDTGEVFGVLATYSGLEDPGGPIPPEATAVNGITNAMVAGKRIDDAKVISLLVGVSLVIAHNAEFDRQILERRIPEFAEVPWGCSLEQVDWKAEGYGARSLDYLAYRCGFFFDAHRSESDCRALLEIIRNPLPGTGERPLKLLHNLASTKEWRVYAVGSPIALKDVLKARGYKFDWTNKVWHHTLPEEEVRAEIAWLKESIYKRDKVTLEFEQIDATVRFSVRPGKRIKREV